MENCRKDTDSTGKKVWKERQDLIGLNPVEDTQVVNV